MTKDITLKGQFTREHTRREPILERWRELFALIKPHLLPPEGHEPTDRLPENYQSIAAQGHTSLAGQILFTTYPGGLPSFEFPLPSVIQRDPNVSNEFKQELKDLLMMRKLYLISRLEEAHLMSPNNRGRVRGFISTQRQVIERLLIAGDTLEFQDETLRIKSFRNDHYVTVRDGNGDVMHHITTEAKDPLALNDDMLDKAKLKRKDLQDKAPDQRMMPMISQPRWNPETKRWVIRQELNGHDINEYEETITPYFSTTYDLTEGDHYGRGFFESYHGDLNTLDTLEKRIIEFADMASRFHPAFDVNSNFRWRSELKKPSGEPWHGLRVKGGQIDDFAWVKMEKFADFRVIQEVVNMLRGDLSKAFLRASDSVRNSERTTAFEVSETVLKDQESSVGGIYASISDQKQLPQIRRTQHVLEKNRELATLTGPDGKRLDEIRILTGLASLVHQRQGVRVLNFVERLQSLGETAMARVNMDVLIDVIARLEQIDEPGLVKTPEQIRAEQQAAQAAAAQAAVQDKAVDVVGNIAQHNATAA